MIIDMHSHVDGVVWKKKRQETVKGFEYDVFLKRIYIPHHPFMPSERVDKYYSELTPQRYIEDMDEAGIAKSVILCLPRQMSNKNIYDLYIKKYPDRLIGFAGVEPFDGIGRFNKDALRELEMCIKDYGFKGMKLVPTYLHYAPNNRKVYPLYEKCDELEIPVTIHQAATPVVSAKLKFARPLLLEDVADDFPNLNIIAAHMGYPWTEELLALMQKRFNIYTDISHLCHLPMRLTWNLTMAKEYHVLDRVMFGTDTSCRPPKYYVSWLKNDLNQIAQKAGWLTLSEEEIDGILGKNAMKLLRLE